MHCDEVMQLLEAYLDGELDEDRGLAVGTHLASCDQCRRRLEARRELGELLRRELEVTAPAALRRRLQHAASPPARAAPRRWRLLAAVAGLAVAAVSGLWWSANRPSHRFFDRPETVLVAGQGQPRAATGGLVLAGRP